MSARINLAPEVYQNSQRNKRNRQLATTIGSAVAGISVAIVIVLIVISGAQKLYIKSATDSIKKKQQEIAQMPDLVNAVTAAKAVETLQTLNSQKVYISRFFEVFQESTPTEVGLSELTIDATNNMALEATAKSFSLAAKLAKALEANNTEVGKNASPTNSPYFTNIRLKELSANGDGTVHFKLDAMMAPEVTADGE